MEMETSGLFVAASIPWLNLLINDFFLGLVNVCCLWGIPVIQEQIQQPQHSVKLAAV